MKHQLLLLLGLFALIQLGNTATACTTGTYLKPCIQLYLSTGNNIGCTSGAICKTIGLTTSTSFDPNPTETTPCTGCELQVEDCNGSIEQCNDGNTLTPDWNQINTNNTFENDITCASDCDRAGVVEDTVFNTRISANNAITGVGSRFFRACWYDNGVLVNCSENYERIHWYKDTGVPPFGSSTCLPVNNNNTTILNRNPTTGGSCYYKNSGNAYTQTPSVFWLEGNLRLTNSILIFDGVSIDFNLSVVTLPHIIMDGNSRIFFWNNTVSAWTDINISGIDRNKIFIGRYDYK